MNDTVKRKDIDWVSKLFGGISKLVSGLVWWEQLSKLFGGAVWWSLQLKK